MKQQGLTGYELSKDWFDFAFANTDLVSPNHSALMFWIIEKWNRLKKAAKFGLPTDDAMTAIGIRNWRTYKNTLDDLVKWGFVEMVEKSRNQYTANIIAIVKNTVANESAYVKNTVAPEESATVKNTKASQKHCQKHCRSTVDIIKGYKGLNTVKDLNSSVTNVTGAEEISGSDPGLGMSEKKERKKTSAQKKKEKAGDVTDHWHALVEVWFEFNKKNFDGFEPSFKGSDPKHLKTIVEILRKRSINRGLEWTQETARKTLWKFFEHSYTDEWLRKNFLLQNLERQLDKIIKNGTGTTTAAKSGLDYLKASIAADLEKLASNGGNY